MIRGSCKELRISFSFRGWSSTNACDDPKMKNSLPEEGKKQIIEAVDECIKWVDENPSAEADEFEAKQKELEEKWKPLMMKAYQAGGMPGGPGMPGADGAPGEGAPGADGPKIDEVD